MISVASTLLLVSLVFGTSVPSAWAAPVGTRNLDVTSLRRLDTRELTGMRREHHSATTVVPRDDDVPISVVARAGAPEAVSSDADTTVKPSKPKMRRHHAKNEEKSPDDKPRNMPRFKRDAIPRREREVVARKEDATSSNVAREDEKVKRSLFNGTATPGGGVHDAGKSDSGKRDVHDRTIASPRVPVTHEGGDAKPDPAKRDVPAVKPAESSPPKVAARHHHEGHGRPKKDCGKQEPPTPAPTPAPTPTETPDATETNTETKRQEGEVSRKREEKLIKPIAIFRRALAFEDLD